MTEQRGSDKHGPRQDEELKHEVEGMLRSGRSTRAEEWKEPEPSAEGDPEVDLAPNATLTGGTPPGLDSDDVEGRSELARHLQPSVFPADREALLASADEVNAPDRIRDILARLPSGELFSNVQDVWSALGGGGERRRTG